MSDPRIPSTGRRATRRTLERDLAEGIEIGFVAPKSRWLRILKGLPPAIQREVARNLYQPDPADLEAMAATVPGAPAIRPDAFVLDSTKLTSEARHHLARAWVRVVERSTIAETAGDGDG